MDIQSLIATVIQTNWILGIIDKHRNDDKITLKAIQSEWTSLFKLEGNKHFFLNQYQYITSLLAFIVLPEQEIYNDIPEINISMLPPKWGIKGKGDIHLKDFIRRMRNSIVHGNIDFSESLTFSFSDVNPRNCNDSFSCSLTQDELRGFVHSFTLWIMTKQIEWKPATNMGSCCTAHLARACSA